MSDPWDDFRSPSSQFRGKPFWAWNGRLEEGELRRQIRVLHRMGMGGFFMHSRVGLATAYLSEEWMRLVQACIDEAQALGMEAWLYDEDRWPSGAAGGIVTRDERFRQRRLRLEIRSPDEFAWDEDIRGAWIGVVADDRVSGLRPIARGAIPGKVPPEAGLLVFRETTAPDSPWYNGYTYLDTLSEEAVRRFIEVTHEAYLREVGQAFGGVVPGIFTDEPNHGLTCSAWEVDQASTRNNEIPWTADLPRVFRQRYGYDLMDHLPELFLDVEGREVSKARYHYHDCKTHLFVNAFARQIGAWCRRHGLAFTGHVLEEATPSSQTNVVGSAMRFYEHMQAPGIDILTEPNREYDTAKQCASVARQTGATWILSELYGCTGWEFPFEGHKAVGDWQAALGVNLRCQHLSWYTMAGEAKRDYPASIHFHSPWWEDYPVVEDYFARIGAVLTRGAPVRKLLVIHPLESTWLRCRIGFRGRRDVLDMDSRLERLRDALLEASLDFDYGDEEMLGRLGAVGELDGRPSFFLGKAGYRCVLVPPLITMRSSTVDLLARFAEAGGAVIFAGDPPGFVDAVPSAAAADLAARCVHLPWDPQVAAEAAAPFARVLSVRGPDGAPFRRALSMLRADGMNRYLFIVNTDRSRGAAGLTVDLEDEGYAEEWDPATGERRRADASAHNGRLRIRTSLPASGSRLFVIRPEPGDLPPPAVLAEREWCAVDEGPWEVVRDEPNVLVLDQPEFRLPDDDGDAAVWQGREEVLRLDTRLRRRLGLEPRGGAMLQPWARPRRQGPRPSCRVELRHRIRVESVPPEPVWLALEQPERAEITLNGRAVRAEPDGWWVDPCIRRVPLPGLCEGANELVVRFRFDEDADLEAMFLLGEFGVRLRGVDSVITPAPHLLAPGDWAAQDLPFYAAAVTYRIPAEVHLDPGDRAFVVLPSWTGACVRVRVNGARCGTIAWQPYECDVTESIRPGKNLIELGVVSSRHNAFGPLHQAAPEPAWVGSDNFQTTGDRWQETYQLRACGLLEPPYLSLRTKVDGRRAT